MPAVLLGEKDITENPAPGTAEYTSETVEPSTHTHRTAFMVLVDKEGNYVFEPDINKPVIPERQPTGSEVKGALSAILMDIQTQETAVLSGQMTVNMMMQQAKAAQDQMQNQQVLAQMARSPR